jgi:hypothetical protein
MYIFAIYHVKGPPPNAATSRRPRSARAGVTLLPALPAGAALRELAKVLREAWPRLGQSLRADRSRLK